MCPYQVSCERYDAKAFFKKWDTVSITMSSSFMAYGSTEEKAISRASGGGSLADGIAVMPIAGCVCAAVARDGKPHVMSVTFPASSGVPEQIFAFAFSGARDSFMRALQAKSAAFAAPGVLVSVPVTAEAKTAVGGEALAEVNLPPQYSRVPGVQCCCVQCQYRSMRSPQTLYRSSQSLQSHSLPTSASDAEHDYMRINCDPKFLKMLASNSGGSERLIFSIVGVKVNDKGKSQERALVITNCIYNTMPSDIRKCQRRIPLEKLHHLTVSNSCDNFVSVLYSPILKPNQST
jgi:hypothetical protein